MRYLPLRFALCIFTVFCIQCVEKQPPQGRQVKDELGRTVYIPARIDRLVSLTPGLTEILFALGLDDKIVGVTGFCNYPPAARLKAKVGGYKDTNVEQVAQLKPDLVFASKDGNEKALIDKISIGLGIPVFTIFPQDIEAIFNSIITIGRLTGTEERALLLVTGLKQRLAAVQQTGQGKARPTVLCIIGENPLYTVGPGSFPHDAIGRAGGENLAADAPSRYPQYSLEKVLAKNPDIIIKTAMVGQPDSVDVFRPWRRWGDLKAVKQGRLYTVDPDIILRPGPRLVEGVEALAKIFHSQ